MVYSVSYKERKRVSWLFERGIGYRRYCKEDNQEASFKGNFNTRLFRIGELGPYNPVGRNKLPRSQNRDKKILERLIITKAIVSKENYLFEKRNSYVKCNEGKRQKEQRTKESHRMD